MSTNFAKKVNDTFTFYQSNYSGINLVFGDKTSDKIESKISIGINDVNGVAHCLEHYVFRGSKNHPYPLIDVAPYFFGRVHAMTLPNITVYHAETMNEEGFLELLPIYLDFIFNPLLSESDYAAEIHHVGKNGYDNGVLFNEVRSRRFIGGLQYYNWMRNSEKYNFNLADLSNYFVEFETIKKAHREHYRMDNCFITINGSIDHEKVLRIVEDFERINQFYKSPTRISDNLFILPPFKNQFVIVNTPFDSDYKSHELIWKINDATFEEYNLISILNAYFIQMYHFNFGMFSNISCQGIDNKFSKPLLYGFAFFNITETKKDYLSKLNIEMHRMLYVQPLDLGFLKSIIRERIKRISAKNVFEFIQKYHIYYDSERQLDDYFGKEKLTELLDKGCDFWKEKIQKYFHGPTMSICLNPDERTNPLQVELEKQRIDTNRNKFCIENGLSKIERKPTNNNNNKNPLKGLDLSNFKDVSVKFTDYIHAYILEKEKFMDLPVIYVVDKTIPDRETVHYQLHFDLDDLPPKFFPLIMIYVKILPRMPSAIMRLQSKVHSKKYEITAEIEKNELIFTLITDINPNLKIGNLIKSLFGSISFPKSLVINLLEFLIEYSQMKEMLEPQKIGECIDNFMLNKPDSINRYLESEITMLKTHQKLLKFITESDANYNKFRLEIIQLHKTISGLNTLLDVRFKDKTSLSQLTVVDWPNFKNYRSNPPNPDEDLEDKRHHLGKKYCFITREACPVFVRRYLQFETIKSIHDDKYVFLMLMNEYIRMFIFRKNDRITGNSHGSIIQISEKSCLVYERYHANNIQSMTEQNKMDIYDMIKNKNVNMTYFELAKRSTLYTLYNKQTAFEKFKTATPEDVINIVGQYYIDLFDDTKTSEAILIPESMKDQINDQNYEVKSFDDLMVSTYSAKYFLLDTYFSTLRF